MARRSSPSSRRRGGKLKTAFWFNTLLLAALGVWFVFQPPTRRDEVTRLVANYFEREKRIEILDIVTDLYRLYYSPDFVSAVLPGDRSSIYAGAPHLESPGTRLRLLVNTGYTVGYSEPLENPLWAAYRIADIPNLPSPAPRPESFEPDARTVSRVTSDTYTNSGYDRGHLAPNYAIATRYGTAAQRETFLLSNIVPQRHTLNAGPWKELEIKIATSYPARFGEVWVFAGPIFDQNPRRLANGRGPAIPTACYMIVIDESDGRIRTQTFLLPQETPTGTDLRRFLVSIDEIERRTGLDFLAELEDGAEAALEVRPASAMW